MMESGKARELGKTEKFIKVVIDADIDGILGATALCEQGSEILQLFVELMSIGASAKTVQGTLHIHPMLSEAGKNAVQLPLPTYKIWHHRRALRQHLVIGFV